MTRAKVNFDTFQFENTSRMIVRYRSRYRGWNTDEKNKKRMNEFASDIGYPSRYNLSFIRNVINNRKRKNYTTKESWTVLTGVIFLESWSFACQPIVSRSRHVYLHVRSDRSSLCFQECTREYQVRASH